MKQRIVITGASDGLGAALLQAANKRGYETINISRRKNKEATSNILLDMSRAESIAEAAKFINTMDHLKAIIFCAGVFSYGNPATVNIEEYERVMNINLKSPLLLTAQVYDTVRSDGIDLVYINSVASQKPFTNQLLYDVSKWSLRGLIEDVGLELRDTKSRVIGVYPGMLDTDIAQKLPTPLPKSKHPMIPPKDLAELIMETVSAPRSMEVTDIIIDRKK